MYIVNGKRFPTVTATGIYGFFRQYRWLSNMHLCTVYIDNIAYRSAEHAYQAMKTTDPVLRERVALCSTPFDAKMFGRGLQLRRGWDNGVRDMEMQRVIEAKFFQNKGLAKLLLETGDLYLEETNNWGDRYMGVVDGHGQNKVGHMLMRTRRKLLILAEDPYADTDA